MSAEICIFHPSIRCLCQATTPKTYLHPQVKIRALSNVGVLVFVRHEHSQTPGVVVLRRLHGAPIATFLQRGDVRHGRAVEVARWTVLSNMVHCCHVRRRQLNCESLQKLRFSSSSHSFDSSLYMLLSLRHSPPNHHEARSTANDGDTVLVRLY